MKIIVSTAFIILFLCKTMLSCANASAPVSVELYYEALCPFCEPVITTQLYPVFRMMPEIVNISLFPYGNAYENTNQYGYYNFACQHGPEECVGNTMESCIINEWPKVADYLPLIACIENFTINHITIKGMKGTENDKNVMYKDEHLPIYFGEKFNFLTVGRNCAKSLHKDFVNVGICTTNSQGNMLQHQEAIRIGLLHHHYVPWFVINGVHNSDLQHEAQFDLPKLVCKLYKGKKPSTCNKYM